MQVVFHINPRAPHQLLHAEALMRGIRRHGITASQGHYNRAAGADIAVIWSWRQMGVIVDASARGAHVLVMERGFLQPREQWCSLALDGFNGRGQFAPAKDGGVRWRRHFAGRMEPWRADGHYELVIGQLPGDSALMGCDIDGWVRKTCTHLLKQGQKVIYRPHPLAKGMRRSVRDLPAGVTVHTGPLFEAFAHARRCITYNSTTAVEAVLAGLPTVADDRGSIAWDVTGHELDDPPRTPERAYWCHDMAWRQWKLEELADGSAWEHVKQCLD